MTAALKIVFAGTPEIAKTVLAKILDAGFKVDLVLTQPDRPKGRGLTLAMSPVKILAQAHAIEVFQPESFRNNPEALAKIYGVLPDIIIVVAYGLILPPELLAIPSLGCVNIHVSLLPRHRGAAPIQRAIIEGDAVTGVTLMQMDRGLDTGPVLLQQELPIEVNDTSGTLHDKLAHLGAEMIVKYLHNYALYTPEAQSSSDVSYAHKIEKTEAEINWTDTAGIISRKIRGFNPFPGCFTHLEGKLVKIWQAVVVTTNSSYSKAESGSVVRVEKNGIGVSCGDETVLLITELQPAGKNRQSAGQFAQGHPELKGKRFQALK